MSAEKKKKAYMTDRATAKKAKTYIYGLKEGRKLAAVTKTNLFLNECMKPETQSCKTQNQKHSLHYNYQCSDGSVLANTICLVLIYGTVISYQLKYVKAKI